MRELLSCDLLIIDDLGTEMANSFTASSLFNCLNERLIRQKSTIISSNLSVDELKQNYTERIFCLLYTSQRLYIRQISKIVYN